MIVKTLSSADRTREVNILKRSDGLFSYREEIGEGDDTAYEQYPDFIAWPRMVHTSGLFGSIEEAEQDARQRVKWMSS